MTRPEVADGLSGLSRDGQNIVQLLHSAGNRREWKVAQSRMDRWLENCEDFITRSFSIREAEAFRDMVEISIAYDDARPLANDYSAREKRAALAWMVLYMQRIESLTAHGRILC